MNRGDASLSREDQAVAWFVQLQDSDDEEVWIAHRDWLEADAANAAAYDAVERIWIDSDTLQPLPLSGEDVSTVAFDTAERANVIDLSERRAAVSRRRAMMWVPAAAAAALVTMVAGPHVIDLFGNAGITYRTDGAAGREIALADGSRMTLNRDTEATVRIEDVVRSVTLISGQAAFDVRHDAARPFTIAAAGHEVRVLGTEFDVFAREGAFGVSVRRGLVSVSQQQPYGKTVKLPAGKALLNLGDGAGDTITDVDPNNALAWRDGRLVYLDSDLGALAHDYERYIGKPVKVAPVVAGMHISGVVKARNEDDLIRQLEQLLPVRIVKTAAGREIRKR